MVGHCNSLSRKAVAAPSLTDFKKYLDNTLRHMVWLLGVSCARQELDFDEPFGSLPTHLWRFELSLEMNLGVLADTKWPQPGKVPLWHIHFCEAALQWGGRSTYWCLWLSLPWGRTWHFPLLGFTSCFCLIKGISSVPGWARTTNLSVNSRTRSPIAPQRLMWCTSQRSWVPDCVC